MSDLPGQIPSSVARQGGPSSSLFLQALQNIVLSINSEIQAVKADTTSVTAAINAETVAIQGLTVINGLIVHQAQGTNGLFATRISILGFHNTDGSVVAAAASAGKFGYSITLGTSAALLGEAAQGNTKTDDAIAEYAMPPWYVAGSNMTVTVNAKLTGTGTAGTKTAQIIFYRVATDGSMGADLGPGTLNITAAGSDMAFAINGASLSPGDMVMLKLETVLQETGGIAPLLANINSVRLS